MCGIVGIKNQELAKVSLINKKLYFVVNATGVGLAPFECFLLMRGIKTLSVRMERQQQSALKIAQFLEGKGFKVRYPGLKSHPQYELHHSIARGSGAVLSFETGSTDLSERIVENTRLWLISVSFGCVNSLIS
jgi:cystathionine beta-lyase